MFDGTLPKEIEPMTRVVVVKADRSKLLIVTLELLRRSSPLQIGSLRLTWRAGQASAVDTAADSRRRDVGTVDAHLVAPGKPDVPPPYDF